jgi:hypothetical protein
MGPRWSSAGSYRRNVQKMGFQIACLRPNWLYQTGS